jgi:membrane protein
VVLNAVRVLRQTWRSYREHEGSLLAGAIAFYALLALAPSGVLAIAILGSVLGEEAARGELQAQLELIFDENLALFLAKAIERSAASDSSWATSLSVVIFLFVSVRLFWMLRAALNLLWGIRSTLAPGFRGLAGQVLRRRLLAFVMVFAFGAALFVVAVGKAALSAAAAKIGGVAILYRLLDFGGSVTILTSLVALVFVLLPDAKLHWRDAFLGALVTTGLALAGAYLVGHLVADFAVSEAWGGAGSLIALLVWVYYTAQIFFFGALFTRHWASEHGRGVEPLQHARRVVLESARPGVDPAELLAEQWEEELHALGTDRPNADAEPPPD